MAKRGLKRDWHPENLEGGKTYVFSYRTFCRTRVVRIGRFAGLEVRDHQLMLVMGFPSGLGTYDCGSIDHLEEYDERKHGPART